jgi:hypothetical protein
MIQPNKEGETFELALSVNEKDKYYPRHTGFYDVITEKREVGKLAQ